MVSIKPIRVPCVAEPGFFRDELFVTIPSMDGERHFFMDKSLFHEDSCEGTSCSGTIDVYVFGEKEDELLIAVTSAEMADLKSSRFWIEREKLLSANG